MLGCVLTISCLFFSCVCVFFAAVETQAANSGNVGKTSLWVKMLSQWATFGLYVWTLVAPRCCPGRDFDH